MNKTVSVDLEELLPVIKEKLALGGSFTFSPKGISMLPIIRPGTDSVTISPVQGRLKKYDLPLYRRDNGQFVLHRVISVKKRSYVMCGDNQIIPEFGIEDRHVIGVVSKIIKPEGAIDVCSKDYMSYARKRVVSQFRKGIYVRFKRKIKKMLIRLNILKGAKD